MKALLLLICLQGSYAVVKLSNSQLFGEPDFLAIAKQPLTVCETGCYVYGALNNISTNGADNIFVTKPNGKGGREDIISIAKLSAQLDEKNALALIPLELGPGGDYAIENRNPGMQSTLLVVYVVAKTINGKPVKLPFVFDPYNERDITVKSTNRITFLSANWWTFDGAKLSKSLPLRIFTTGFDTMHSEATDVCFPIYNQNKQDHSGISLPIRGPILTLSTDEPVNITFYIKRPISGEPVYSLTSGISTAITSPGYIGCRDGQVFHYISDKPGLLTQVTQGYRAQGEINVSFYMDMNTRDSIKLGEVSSIIEVPGSLHGANINYPTVYARGVSFSLQWNRTHLDEDGSFAVQITPSDYETETTTKSSPTTILNVATFISLISLSVFI